MAEDWSTREKSLARIITKFGVCRSFRIDASAKLVIFNSNYGTETDPITRGLFGYISQTLTPIVNFMRQLLNQDSGNDPEYMIPYFLDHYTVEDGAEEFELTWQKIILAWGAAPLKGIGNTIKTIDDMRLQIWNTPDQDYYPFNVFEDEG